MKLVLMLLLLSLFNDSTLAQEHINFSSLDSLSKQSGLNLSLPEDLFYRSSYEKEKSGIILNDLQLQTQLVHYQISPDDLKKIVAASAVAVVFFAHDREIMDFVQEHKNTVSSQLATIGEGYASEWGIGAIGAGYIIGVVMENNSLKSVSVMAAKASFVSGMVTTAVKASVGRVRPSDTESPYQTANGNHSFPSGHTTQAFAIATVIAEATKDQNKYIPILAYSLAALGGWSRVHDNRHWASDVIVGGLIGHLVAKGMMRSNLNEKGFLIVPHLGANTEFSINITYTGKKRNSKMKCGKDFYPNMSERDSIRDCLSRSLKR